MIALPYGGLMWRKAVPSAEQETPPVQQALEVNQPHVARHSPSVSIWGGDLELLQVLPQRGPRILSPRYAALLE